MRGSKSSLFVTKVTKSIVTFFPEVMSGAA